jgi:programmed cell death protein 4
MSESSDKPPALTEQQQGSMRDRARSVGCWAGSIPQMEAQKLKILSVLYELSDTGAVKDCVATIEQDKSIEGIELTKRALIFGIEHSSYERELISQLLSAVYDIFEGRELLDGFQLLLYRLPDLVLDVPNAPQILAKFISRAIYDEILPPAFVKDAIVDNNFAKETLSLVYAISFDSLEKRRLEHIWGPGDLTSVEQLKDAVESTLREYFENPDPVAAASSVKELNAPSFASQIIKQALRLAIDLNTEDAKKNVIALLASWHQINLMSDFHVERGFLNMSNQIDDLKLDVPNAPQMFTEIVHCAIENKILPATFGK